MKTKEIINKLDTRELLKWESEVKSILNELDWKLTKAERALYLHQTGLEEVNQKLQIDLQRMEETKKAIQYFSETHPLRYKCEEDLLKTEIRIFRLQNRLRRFSPIKLIQLEIRKIILAQEIKYYETVLESIENMLRPVVVLRKVSETADGEVGRNVLPDEQMMLFMPQLKQEAVDVGNYFLSVG